MRIAAVLACYNRREKTLACLSSLFRQALPDGMSLSVYLLDDASSDGTGAAVRETFPEVRILDGDGSFFWNGGMRAAFGAAIGEGYDFYLWLNDDVKLYDDFLVRLVGVHAKLASSPGAMSIVIGAVVDPKSRELNYSGMQNISRWHPMKFRKVVPDASEPLECDTMNGNCVLIPAAVVEKVGNISPAFTHAMGDMDYGFRARKKGARLWVAPGPVGECESNDKRHRWQDVSLPIGERLKILNSPHGLPLLEYAQLLRQCSPVLWPFYALLPYMKAVTCGIGRKPSTGRD